MLNWGLWDLRVVDPVCDINSTEARRLAVGSVEVLERAKVFSTISSAISDLQLVYPLRCLMYLTLFIVFF